MQKKTADNLSIAFFLVLVLFLPKTEVFTRLYFAILLVTTPILLGWKKLTLDWLSLTGIGMLGVIIISTLLRFGFVVELNIRDYTEFARFLLPVLMLIFRDKFKNLTMNTLFIVFAFYCGVNFIVSFLDFANIKFMGITDFSRQYYVSKGHADTFYRISGLSAGPGQHGVKMLVIFIFFYIRAFQSKKITLPLIFSALAAIPLFLSQTRTAIIVFILISISVPLFFLIFGRGKQKKRAIPILAIIGGGGAYLFSLFITYFDRVLELSKGFQQVSSFQKRESHYDLLFDKAMEYPIFFVIGYGKDFFKTSVFDNEYLLMFLVHGPVVTLLIVGGVIAYILVYFSGKEKVKYEYGTMLLFLFSAGLVVAFPSTFFLQFALIPIIATLINLTYWESRNLNLYEK